MNCEVCKRPLFEGASACIVCGAPVPPPQAAPSAQRIAAATQVTQAPIFDAYAPSAPEPLPAPSPYGPPPPGPQYAPPPAPQYAPPPARMAPMAPMGAMNSYAQAPRIAAPHNHAATAAFICGLLGLVPLWIGFVLCIVAIVCGIIGIQHAGRTPDQQGRSFAIAGLVLALVFILPAACGI